MQNKCSSCERTPVLARCDGCGETALCYSSCIALAKVTLPAKTLGDSERLVGDDPCKALRPRASVFAFGPRRPWLFGGLAGTACWRKARARRDWQTRVARELRILFGPTAAVKHRAAGAFYTVTVLARTTQARIDKSCHGAPAVSYAASTAGPSSMRLISRGVHKRMRWPVTPRPQFTYNAECPRRNKPRSNSVMS